MGWDGRLSFCFYLSAGSRAGGTYVLRMGEGGNVEAVRSGKKVCKMVVQ